MCGPPIGVENGPPKNSGFRCSELTQLDRAGLHIEMAVRPATPQLFSLLWKTPSRADESHQAPLFFNDLKSFGWGDRNARQYQTSASRSGGHPTDFLGIFEERGSKILHEGKPFFLGANETKRPGLQPQPLRRSAFMSFGDHPARASTRVRARWSTGYFALYQRGTAVPSDQPSMAAISDAFPPAAVVSMHVTRSVAKRAT